MNTHKSHKHESARDVCEHPFTLISVKLAQQYRLSTITYKALSSYARCMEEPVRARLRQVKIAAQVLHAMPCMPQCIPEVDHHSLCTVRVPHLPWC